MISSVSSTTLSSAASTASSASIKGDNVQVAAQISVMKMANDQQGQAAMQLLQSAVTGKGANISVSA